MKGNNEKCLPWAHCLTRDKKGGSECHICLQGLPKMKYKKKRIYIKELETIVEDIDREKGIDKQENRNNGHQATNLGL